FADSTSNAKDGTLTDEDADSTRGAAAKADGGIDLAGDADYIQTTSDDLKTADTFTISLWFKADSTAFSHHLVWQGISTGNGYGEPTYVPEMHITMGTSAPIYTDNVLTFFLGDCDRNAST